MTTGVPDKKCPMKLVNVESLINMLKAASEDDTVTEMKEDITCIVHMLDEIPDL